MQAPPKPRDIPGDVRRRLREEAAFGCVVCGNPYLTYHHFDPPWHKEQHHRPEDMVAMCLAHASQADGGAYTCDQIRAFKSAPFLKNLDASAPAAAFSWKRQRLAFWCGTNLFFHPHVLVRAGMDVIWLDADDNGNALLSLDIRNKDGDQILLMRRNEWQAYDFADLECGCRASKLFVKHEDGSYLRLRWRHMDQKDAVSLILGRWEAYRRTEVTDAFMQEFGNDDVTLLELQARIHWPRPLRLQHNRIVGPVNVAGLLGRQTVVAFNI